MRKIICFTAFFGLIAFFSCEETSQPCTYARRIAVESGCYNPTRGLRLVALGVDPDHTDLTWEIHVLSDLANGWTPDDIEINESAGETFTIPDSVLVSNIHVLAKVITDCDGTYLHSGYFSFIRINSANCTIWMESEI